jgi:hypothetical protein
MFRLRSRAIPDPKRQVATGGFALPKTGKELGKTSDRAKAGKSTGSKSQKSPVEQILDYIPLESIAAYQAIFNASAEGSGKVYFVLVIALLILTFIYMLFAPYSKSADKSLPWEQAVTATLALILWLIGTNSPFWLTILPKDSGWNANFGTAILGLGVLALPAIGRSVRALIHGSGGSPA